MDGEEVLQRRVLGEREQHRTRAAHNDTFLGTAELSLMPTTLMSAGMGLNEDAFCGLDSIYSFKDPKVVFHGDTAAGGVRNKGPECCSSCHAALQGAGNKPEQLRGGLAHGAPRAQRSQLAAAWPGQFSSSPSAPARS